MTDSGLPPFTVGRSAPGLQLWWLYQAWVESGNAAPIHVYGLVVPIGRIARPLTERHKLSSGATLCVSQLCFDGTDANGIALLEAIYGSANVLELSKLLSGAPNVLIKHRRRVQCPFPGHSTAQAIAAYGLPVVPNGLPADTDLAQVVDLVAKDTGIRLRDRQISHIGGFDLFELGEKLEASSDFRFQLFQSAENNHDNVMRIWRVSDDSTKWIAHIQLSGDGEVVWEGLKFSQQGTNYVEVIVKAIVDGLTYELFDESGTLLHREECAYLREIGMNTRTLGRTLEVRDRLASQTVSQGKRHPFATGSVATTSHASSVTHDPDGLRRYRMRIRDHMDYIVPPISADRWFHRSLDEQLGVIAHLNQLLDFGTVESAVIVDPFFGPDAIERLLTRLSSNSLQLTIVSCWGKTDLDTARPLSQQDVQNERLVKHDLPLMLDRLGPLLSVQLRFINVVTGDGGPAFHDRYLLLRNRGGDRHIYVLSNSINNLAVNWPFCMSQLSGQARIEAARYIEGLCHGYDATESTTTKINFEWPKPTKPLA